MQSKKKLPVWLTGLTLGVSVVALPSSAPLFAQAAAAAEPQKVEGKEVPEVIRKEFRSQVKNAQDLAFFRWPQADGRVLYVVRGNAGEDGPKKMMIFAQDGTVVEGVGPSRPNDKLVAPKAGTAGTAAVGAATGEMAELQALTTKYQAMITAERAESDAEAQRARDVATRQQSGALKGTALDELERQGAEREKAALTRYQEAIRQSDEFRAKAAAAPAGSVKDQYAELQRMAEVRARVNAETARFATETQRALDQAEMAAAGGATDAPAGTTRKRVDVNDLPPRVRETFGRQTDGATNPTYYATTADGRTTYTANYTRGSEQWFIRSNAEGQITRGPVPINDDTRLASGRQAGSSGGAGSAADLNDDEAGKGSGLSLETLPAAVRKTFQSKMDARAEKFATFVKHEKNGKTTYHAIWHPNGDNSKNAHLFVDETGKVTRELVKDNPNAK